MYTKKSSFSSGELDPALHDKTDVQSYYSGLKKARNVLINKTGRIINASGTWVNTKTKFNDEKTIIYVPEVQIKPNSLSDKKDYILEFGENYVRVYIVDFENDNFKFDSPAGEVVTDYTSDELAKLTIKTVDTSNGRGIFRVYVACPGKPLRFINLSGPFGLAVFTGLVTPSAPILRSFLGFSYPVVAPSPPLIQSSSPYVEYTGTAAAMAARIGHEVQYGVTVVLKDGRESTLIPITGYKSSDTVTLLPYMKLPTGTEFSGIFFKNLMLAASQLVDYGTLIDVVRMYRRPFDSGAAAWGLVGESDNNGASWSSATVPVVVGFTDFGQSADYTNPPPKLLPDFTFNFMDFGNLYLQPDRISTYTNRLLLIKNDSILYSRLNQPGYYLQDFPLAENNSFLEVIGVNKPTVYYTLDYNGHLVFSSDGIHYGGLDSPVSAINPFLRRVGKDLIDPLVPPIITPYGLLFLDKTTNSVRTLQYNNETKGVTSEDISLFSSHIFYGKRVTSWAFQGGDNAGLFVVLNDGTAASLTYNPSSKMNAWTTHDTDGKYLRVESYRSSVTGESFLFFVISRNGIVSIESSSTRVKSSHKTIRAFSHSSTKKIFKELDVLSSISETLVAGVNAYTVDVSGTPGVYWDAGKIGEYFAIYDTNIQNYIKLKCTAVVPGVSATLETIDHSDFPVGLFLSPQSLIQTSSGFAGVGGTVTLRSYLVLGGTWETMVFSDTNVTAYWTDKVGKSFGVFVPSTESYIHLTVTSVTPGTLVEFSVDDAPVPLEIQDVTTSDVYLTHTIVGKLEHLEGRKVSVVCDSAVVGSPLNDVENLTTHLVVGGKITLEDPAVLTIVGLPYVSDVETLEIDNQAGTLSRESKIVNEVTVRYIRSRGVYVSGYFPDGTYVLGMEDSADWDRFSGVNQTLKDTTSSKTYRPQSSWNTNGKMCFRQVDPLPFEIASIILDVSGG